MTGLEILETKEECLIRRLSRFDSRKVSVTTESGRWTLRGARGLARRSAALRRRVLRLVAEEGAVGALGEMWLAVCLPLEEDCVFKCSPFLRI